MVHTYCKHEGISRKSKDDNPLVFTFQVGLGILHDGPDTSRLYSTLSTNITFFLFRWLSLLEHRDALPVDDIFHIHIFDCAIDLVVDKIILEHVDHVGEVNVGGH